MKSLSQREGDFSAGNGNAVIQQNNFRGKNCIRKKRHKTVSGEQISLRFFPTVKGDGKTESFEKGFAAVKTFAGRIEKAVVAVKDSFNTAFQGIGTVAQFLFDIGNRESFGQGVNDLFDIGVRNIFERTHLKIYPFIRRVKPRARYAPRSS